MNARGEEHVVGMELHYKITMTESKANLWNSTDTVVVLGYKFIQYAMNVRPADLPDESSLKQLTF